MQSPKRHEQWREEKWGDFIFSDEFSLQQFLASALRQKPTGNGFNEKKIYGANYERPPPHTHTHLHPGQMSLGQLVYNKLEPA